MNARLVLGWSRVAAVALLLTSINTASGQSFGSGSTGADGAFNPLTNQTITVKPGGVYNFTTVNIPGGVTVRYVRGADNAAVTILAMSDVNISGVLTVSGNNGVSADGNTSGTVLIGALGGPGGFNGGNGGVSGGPSATGGQGPGGGQLGGSFNVPGVYAAPDSFVSLIPLFGGSGGGGGVPLGGFFRGGSGAGGGGAVLIASSSKITINGQVLANGGNITLASGAAGNTCGGTGSGGAIRLVAGEITGSGVLQANKGTENCGGVNTVAPGRIRLEAFTLGFTGTSTPVASMASAPGPVSPVGNPTLVNVPTLTFASIGGIAVPSTTNASYYAPDVALAPGTANPVPVVLTATNTPVGSPTVITVRFLPQGSPSSIVIPVADHTGTFSSSSATANVTFPVGQVSVIQAFAAFTLTGQTASLFPLIDGEPVERVMVAVSPGQPSTVSLVSKSGKEIRVEQLPFEDQLLVAQAWSMLGQIRAQ